MPTPFPGMDLSPLEGEGRDGSGGYVVDNHERVFYRHTHFGTRYSL